MIHILPVGDTKKHTEDSTCICNPSTIIENGEIIVIHNAFDNREFIEQLCDDLNEIKTIEGVDIHHWAIKCLIEIKSLIERYNNELPSETSKCSNHIYNEIQSILIKNDIL